MSSEQTHMLIGIILLLLSASYAHKFFMSAVQGKCWIWTGFLPFTIVSPLLLHIPPKPNGLSKVVQGMWVHMVMGPIFLVVFLLTLVAGADLVGWPGTYFANKLLTAANRDHTDAISFNKDTYRMTFPAIAKGAQKLQRQFMGSRVGMKKEDELLQGGPTGSYSQAQESVK